ncbi:MAG: T9SS type A sorting domain-containing protein [Bacteroidetes bacterium]|nr:T9SS type A sorting domain-containing protein [Bacteroidota bacterium]
MNSFKYNISKKQVLLFIFFITLHLSSLAVTKTTTGNGNWNSSSTWSPSGQPSASDDVIIATGHSPNVNVSNAQCKSLTIQSGATVLIGNSKKLTVNNTAGLNISGTLNINGGNITIVNNSTNFTVNAGGAVNWNPGDNSSGGATLFGKCIENFSPTSTLTIRKWYSTSVGLGTVVSSNFGNLTISGVSGIWQMQNSLQTRSVQGLLTITSSYIVLDNTGAISNTTIGSIHLTNSSAYLDFYNGTHPGSFSVTTGNVTIAGGELDGFYTAGTGTCNFTINGNLDMTSYGYLVGSHNHNGHFNITINGNASLNRSYFWGINNGSGNITINITGDLTTTKNGSTYSEFYGIVDGNGNSTLTINGSFSNQGYFDLIWNTGVTGVGNGNGSMTIGGTFTQSDGDFRGIWNATTTNSGSCSITIDTLNYSGGIFMVAYSCASGSVNHSLSVTGKATIAFSNSSNIFRGNGLATLSGTQNNSSFTYTCNGPFEINGNASAEFSANTGYGSETILLQSTTSFSGGTINFGFTEHDINFTTTDQFTITGGTIYLSKNSGNSTINLNQNVLLNGGTLNVKNNTGRTNVNISGDLTITSGTLLLYSNSSIASNDSTNLRISGDFTQSNGSLQFTNNTGNTGPICLYIEGGNYNLSGTGSITSGGAGTSSYFGYIIFNNSTNTNYNRSSANHHIEQVKYRLNSGANVTVTGGPMELSSGATAATDYLTVSTDASLNLGTTSIISNGLAAHCGIQVSSSGTLLTANINGLYDGTNNAAISSGSNMDYELASTSTICYNGVDNQKISGYGNGIATATKHKYGSLEIAFNGTADNEYSYLENDLEVRNEITLTSGELKLNGHTLTGELITATTGYVKSEENNAVNNSKLLLAYTPTNKNLTFPFGKNSSTYIPVSINITNNPGTGYITVSTRGTGENNTPLPGLDNVAAIPTINPGGADVSTSHVIDRWWEVNAPGVTATYSLRYAGDENTTAGSVSGGTFNVQQWNGSNFTKVNSAGNGVTTGIGTITATLNNVSGPLVLSSGSASLPIKLLEFTAKLKENYVLIKWATAEEKNNDYFNIERSADGTSFENIEEIDGAGNSSSILHYEIRDNNPLPGTSYYRLKQTDFDGTFTYSPIRAVNRSSNNQLNETGIEILSLSPNPFSNEFSVKYNLTQGGESSISIYSMTGQLVYDQKRVDDSGINTFNFMDENNLPPANYILQIINGSEKISKKLVKN